jgi:hypothetical protein
VLALSFQTYAKSNTEKDRLISEIDLLAQTEKSLIKIRSNMLDRYEGKNKFFAEKLFYLLKLSSFSHHFHSLIKKEFNQNELNEIKNILSRPFIQKIIKTQNEAVKHVRKIDVNQLKDKIPTHELKKSALIQNYLRLIALQESLDPYLSKALLAQDYIMRKKDIRYNEQQLLSIKQLVKNQLDQVYKVANQAMYFDIYRFNLLNATQYAPSEFLEFERLVSQSKALRKYLFIRASEFKNFIGNQFKDNYIQGLKEIISETKLKKSPTPGKNSKT